MAKMDDVRRARGGRGDIDSPPGRFEKALRESSLGETMDDVDAFWEQEKKKALTGMPEEQADWEADE